MTSCDLDTAKTYLLEIYDVEDYDGPNPVHVSCTGFIHGPERSQYCILQPDDRFTGLPFAQLAVRPHYDGDKINRAVESVCTVSISLPASGVTYSPGERYGFADFEFWKVGKIHPPKEAE